MKRREFLADSLAVVGVGLLGSGRLAHGQDAPAGPVVPGPEVDAFKQAQEAFLKKYGVTAQSRYVKLKKPPLTVHVLEAGRGDPVVLIHGGGSFACGFVPLMSSLQKEYRVFAPDRPGCGLTDKFNYSETALREHAVDFVTSVLDGLDISKATLVGNSMGGLWAMQFALAKPERVTKLVLLGEPAWSPEVMTNTSRPVTGKPTIEGVRGMWAARLVADIQRVPDEALQAALAARLLPGADMSFNSLIEKFTKDKQGTYHLRPELKNLRPATLFIWGDKDKFAPPKLGEEMAKLAPNARCETLADAGHLPWLEQPERCNRMVLDFLKEGK